MMIELLVENKADGKIYEISDIVTTIHFSDELNNGCSKLDFSYVYTNKLFSNGSIVRFRYNNVNVFYGYIFSYETTQDNEVSVVAYDQLRYLKAKDTFVISDMRLDELIRHIAAYFKLKVGSLSDTGFKLSNTICDNQTYLDMIYEGIASTLLGTGRKYAFFDDFGSLALVDLQNLKLPLILGDESLVYGFKYGQSIDDNTYNLIKIDKSDEKTGKREAYIAQDSQSFPTWGILQYYETADKDANPEQLKSKVNSLLKLLNAETKSMSMDLIGDIRIRSGNSILARIKALNIDQYLIVSSCKHSFEGANHTMSMELML